MSGVVAGFWCRALGLAAARGASPAAVFEVARAAAATVAASVLLAYSSRVRLARMVASRTASAACLRAPASRSASPRRATSLMSACLDASDELQCSPQRLRKLCLVSAGGYDVPDGALLMLPRLLVGASAACCFARLALARRAAESAACWAALRCAACAAASASSAASTVHLTSAAVASAASLAAVASRSLFSSASSVVEDYVRDLATLPTTPQPAIS